METLAKILTTFEKMAATRSRLEKTKLIKHLLESSKAEKMLREIIQYTYHPYWNYWVQLDKIPDKLSRINMEDVEDKSWNKFRDMLNDLRGRVVTGNKARELVQYSLSRVPTSAAKWFIQILNRELRIGFLLKSFEKHLPGVVPQVKPMLATKWNGKDVNEPVAIESKLDGNRCLVIFDHTGEGTAITRNGLPFYNMEHVVQELYEELGEDCHGKVFDGEPMSKTWGDTTSATHSKNKKVKGLIYNIFDMLTLEEWESRKCSRNLRVRRRDLLLVVGGSPQVTKHVTVIAQQVFPKLSRKDIIKLYEGFVSLGLEGLMIKPLSSPYEFKRSKFWMKVKFKRTDEFRIVGRIEGRKKYVGMLGALIVKGNVEGIKVKSEVGQGFEDHERKYFWKLDKEELYKLIIEVEHYGVTSALRKDNDQKYSAIRNGVFLKIRKDKMER